MSDSNPISRPGLRHVLFQTYNRDIGGILSLLNFGADGQPDSGPRSTIQLNLSPPYQRDSVWGLERRQNLIRSLLQGIPYGAVFINSRDIMEPSNCVDGRQRIESFIKYVSGEFTVPAAWWDSDKVFLSDLEIRARFLDPAGEIGFADLNQQGKRWFLRQPLPTHETTFKTLAEEEALFELINHGGCAQGSVDDD